MMCNGADRSVVTVLTTLHQVYSGSAVALREHPDFKLVSRRTKDRAVVGTINVRVGNQPPAVNFYSTFMDGVDTADQRIQVYTVHRPSRRWYMCMFYRMLDIALANAFVLFKTSRGDCLTDQLSFRNSIVNELVGTITAVRGMPLERHLSLSHLPVYRADRRTCCYCAVQHQRRNTGGGQRPETHWYCPACASYYCMNKERNCFTDRHSACPASTAGALDSDGSD